MANREPQAINKSAQPYDERFPDADVGFESDENMTKVFGEFDCVLCGRKTAWVHSKLAAYLCSHDCLTIYLRQ